MSLITSPPRIGENTMPSIMSDSLVLVTGATGFLGSHIALQLLQRNFRVRATVRSKEKGQYLVELFAKHGHGPERFEFVIVEDIEKEGAFNSAVKGVDGIIHSASPVHFNVIDPWKDMINPAVQGTLNVLRSALLEPKIQRVVYTSSVAAILTTKDPVYTWTEDDWNTESEKEVREKGKQASANAAYRASKTLAEQAAWKFIDDHKNAEGVAPFDLVTIQPPFIFGPVIQQTSGPKSLNASVEFFYAFLRGDKKDDDAVQPSGSWVDVRDVAKMHIESLAREQAAGKRFLVSTDNFIFQQLLDILARPEHSDLMASFPNATKGHPGAPKPVEKMHVIDTTRAENTLGFQPIELENMVVDMTRSLRERQKEWEQGDL